MATEKISIGVVGMGAIGPAHVFGIEHTPAAELMAVCDVRPEAAEEAGEIYDVPHFTSVEDMLDSDLVDAVTICTPSGWHLEPALLSIEAGKHVLLEKPMEITPERIDQIREAAGEAGVKLAGVFQSRFKPLVIIVKQLIDSGALGEIHTGSAYVRRYRDQEYYDSGKWRGTMAVDGGGCLMNQGIHLVDLFTWLLGETEEVRAVTAMVGRRVEVETLAFAIVTFASGVRGMIQGTTLYYPEYPDYIELLGSRGTISFTASRVLHLDLMDPTPREAELRDQLTALSTVRRPATKSAPGTAVPSVDMGHTPVIADFVDAIRQDRKPLVDGWEGRRSVGVICAAYESSQNGGAPVRIAAHPERRVEPTRERV